MRKILLVTLGLLGSVVLSGCGQSFQGSLTGRDPVGGTPSPSTGQPVVSTLSPASVTAGGPSFTLTLTGKNFASGDTVEWDNAVLSSTYISSTQMTAQVPTSLIARPTTASIVVQRPVRDSITFGAAICVNAPTAIASGFTVSTVNVEANDMAWDPVSQQFYLSVAGTDPAHPNTITSLNPITRQFGAFVSAGTGANLLAVSSESSWLYAGIDKDGTIQRFVLPGLIGDLTVPLGSDATGAPYTALALEPAPGNPSTIAVSRAASILRLGSVTIFDGATSRPSIVMGGPIYPLGSLTWNGSGSIIYANYLTSPMDEVFTLSVSGAGVQQTLFTQLNTTSQSWPALNHIHYSAFTGYIYGENGQIFNPVSAEVNWLPLAAFGGLGNSLMALDDNRGIAWFVGRPPSGLSQQYVLAAFDLRTTTLIGYATLSNVVGTPVRLLRWGSNGLAFLTTTWNGALQGDGVYIVFGSFVTNPSAN